MAIYGANDGLYGTGTFGTAVFGSLSPVKAITGVSGTGEIEPPEIGGFEVDIGIRLTATTVGTGSVGSLQPNIKAEISGVTATVSLGQITIDALEEILTVVGTGSVGSVGAGVTPNITGVTATGQVGSISTIHVSEIIVSAGGTATLGTGASAGITTTAVVFDFNSVRDQYSKRRSVIIPRAA
tara:strand:+ start:834 stop:1382 length:549 start_codon:yes stop_codon:yes gene_type:complete